MSGKVFSKVIGQGKESLYIQIKGHEYFLFSQNHYKSVSEFYGEGVNLNRALDFTACDRKPVHKTMEKLRAYIPYIEKEYGISIFDKTFRKSHGQRKRVRARDCYEGYDVA